MKMNSNNLPNDIEQLKTLVLESHKKINDLEKQTEHWQLKYESLLESFKLAQQHRYKERFGESVSEQLDVVPSQLKVLRYVHPKYVCKTCEGSISIALLPWNIPAEKLKIEN